MNERARLLSYFRERSRAWQLSLLIAVCLVYLPFIENPFFFDDIPFFANTLTETGTHTRSVFEFKLRWLSYASLAWTVELFSDELPHIFHLWNLIIHGFTTILLFFLSVESIGAVIPETKESPGLRWAAWLGALVFACHPVAVYAVGYIVQYSILMATFFSLLMQWAYLRGLLTGKNLWFGVAIAAYFLACFSKEQSVLMPAVLIMMTVLLRFQNKASQRNLWLTWVAFAAIAIFVVLLKSGMGVIGAPYEPMAAQQFGQQGIAIVESNNHILQLLSVMTQAGLFFKYLFLWLIPNPAWMSVDMREPFISEWTAWQGWLGILGFGVYGVLGGKLLLRGGVAGLAGLALLSPWLQFLLEFSTIRIQEPFVLYRSYLWMPSIALLVALGLIKTSSKLSNTFPLHFKAKAHVMEEHGKLQRIEHQPDGFLNRHNHLFDWKALLVLGYVVLLLIPLSWNRLWVFADSYRLWNDAALLLFNEKAIGADRIFYNRGTALMKLGKWDRAIIDLEKVVALSPGLAPVHYALGMAYFSAGRYSNAIEQLDQAIALKPNDANAYYAKGVSLKRLKKDAQAIQQFIKSCELKNVVACMVAPASER